MGRNFRKGQPGLTFGVVSLSPRVTACPVEGLVAMVSTTLRRALRFSSELTSWILGSAAAMGFTGWGLGGTIPNHWVFRRNLHSTHQLSLFHQSSKFCAPNPPSLPPTPHIRLGYNSRKGAFYSRRFGKCRAT
eukprot:g18332.t1